MVRSKLTTLTAEEAAALISHGQTVGFSGFTLPGAPRAVPLAVAARARAEHNAGHPFRIGVVGAATGENLDGALARSDAVAFRTPYQSDASLRRLINTGGTHFFDQHLSLLPQLLRGGLLGPIHWAVIEAGELRGDGELVLTSAVGAAPTLARVAERVIVELNRSHEPATLYGMHDIYEPADPPHRREIPVYRPSDRIGSLVLRIEPSKIAGIVETTLPDEGQAFPSPDPVTTRIGHNVADFLAAEYRRGRIPREFLPIQSGVGNTANAVLSALGDHSHVPAFEMYTEVAQDAVLALMRRDRLRFASTCSLTLSAAAMREFYTNADWYRRRLVMRPQEITNHPELIRRLGVISINTALEVDLAGNVNSTHVMGGRLMNGIGGSGDFTRNAYLSIFVCRSTAKRGRISTVVPQVAHVDHTEHSVQAIVTEHGVADLRNKDPRERARIIIDNCADPSFRDDLREVLARTAGLHEPFAPGAAFAMHRQYLQTGHMQGVNWDAALGSDPLP